MGSYFIGILLYIYLSMAILWASNRILPIIMEKYSVKIKIALLLWWHRSLETHVEILSQKTYQHISRWSSELLLPLNTKKCCVLHLIGSCSGYTVLITRPNSPRVEQQNYLGVIITSDLSWSAHILNVVRKADSVIPGYCYSYVVL